MGIETARKRIREEIELIEKANRNDEEYMKTKCPAYKMSIYQENNHYRENIRFGLSKALDIIEEECPEVKEEREERIEISHKEEKYKAYDLRKKTTRSYLMEKHIKLRSGYLMQECMIVGFADRGGEPLAILSIPIKISPSAAPVNYCRGCDLLRVMDFMDGSPVGELEVGHE